MIGCTICAREKESSYPLSFYMVEDTYIERHFKKLSFSSSSKNLLRVSEPPDCASAET